MDEFGNWVQAEPEQKFDPDTRFERYVASSIVALAAVAVLAVWVAARRLRTPTERER